MNGRRTWAITAALAGTMLLGAALLVGWALRKQSAEGDALALVPVDWRVVRESPGHERHVLDLLVSCESCHARGGEERFAPPAPSVCSGCHIDQSATIHATVSPRSSVGCADCHSFSAKGTSPGECNRCHADPERPEAVIDLHADTDCVSCHQPHDDPSLQPSDCLACHEKKKTRHGESAVAGAEVCTDCHAMHEEREAARRCVECHSEGEHAVSPGAVFKGGHERCVDCHAPHDFSRAGARTCRECHENERVLAAARAPAHRECDSCHPSHQVKAASERACAGCHREVSTAHPPSRAKKTCLGCHPIHPGPNFSGSAGSCSACHTQARSDLAFHAGATTCRSCHDPHPGKGRAFAPRGCASCHAREGRAASRNPGHGACRDCHHDAGHRPESPRPACASCHRQERAEVARGHGDCQSCHASHDGALTARCADCHGRQQLTAPRGHQRCADCHQPHAGSVQKKCADCHRDKSAGPHATLRGGCASCHRAHGPGGLPSPPACESCHQTGALPGLHRSAGHRACTTCHGAHDAPRKDRASCARCHQGLANHEPRARVCTGCHVFAGSKIGR